jgi:phosphonate transport system substrate-binding protein
MTLNFLIAPDFAPEHFGGWHMLNTALQRRSGIGLHLVTPADAAEQSALVAAGRADLVYANPFDATDLIRQQGYVPFARPTRHFDEMVIATRLASSANRVEDLQPGLRIALTNNRDVRLIGLRLLEPADITEADVQWVPVDNYQAAARLALSGEVDAAFFLAQAYATMSRITRGQLKVLVQSAIHDISHVLIAHPRMAAELPAISQALLALGADETGREILGALGMPDGFSDMTQEDAEFMIDLMDTLLD